MASTDKKSCIGESEFVGDYFTTQNKLFFFNATYRILFIFIFIK